MLWELWITRDHWYDIVITTERQHWMCLLQLPQWKFLYLASSWVFQHAYCFHSQLWLTCMYRVHLKANTLLKYQENSVICKNLFQSDKSKPAIMSHFCCCTFKNPTIHLPLCFSKSNKPQQNIDYKQYVDSESNFTWERKKVLHSVLQKSNFGLEACRLMSPSVQPKAWFIHVQVSAYVSSVLSTHLRCTATAAGSQTYQSTGESD